MVCLYPSCKAAGEGTPEVTINAKNDVAIQKGVQKKLLSTSPANSYVNYLGSYKKISQFVGKPTLQTNQLGWSCSNTASPDRKAFWVIGVCSGTANTVAIEVTV